MHGKIVLCLAAVAHKSDNTNVNVQIMIINLSRNLNIMAMMSETKNEKSNNICNPKAWNVPWSTNDQLKRVANILAGK